VGASQEPAQSRGWLAWATWQAPFRQLFNNAEAAALLTSAVLLFFLAAATLLVDVIDLLQPTRLGLTPMQLWQELNAFVRGEVQPQYLRLYALAICVAAGVLSASVMGLGAIGRWMRLSSMSSRMELSLCLFVVVVLLLPAHAVFLLPSDSSGGELSREAPRAYRDALTFGWSAVLLAAIPILAAVSTNNRLRHILYWASLVGVFGTYLTYAAHRGSRTENELLVFGVALTSVLWMGVRARRARDGERELRGKAETALVDLRVERTRYGEQSTAAIEQLLRSQQQLEHKEAARASFLASAAHDLRQPLQALSIYIDLLARALQRPALSDASASSDQAVQRYLRVLKEENLALGSAFDAILDYSEIESGVRPVEQQACDLCEVMLDLERRFAPVAQKKGLVLQFLAPRQVRYVLTDRALLVRALSNLLSNAVKYTPGRADVREGPVGSADVLVRVRRRGLLATIYVIDYGCGIPKDKFQAIFQPGVQLANAARDRRKGYGLGLAIVLSIVRKTLPGHDVRLRSIVDRGSHFMLDVPCVLGDVTILDSDASEEAAVPLPQAAEERMLDGALVVIVEDDPAVLSGLVEIVKLHGAFVIHAAGLEELQKLLALEDRFPDIVVSDYRLPSQRTGKEVIEFVRSHCADTTIPAIIYTADIAAAESAVRDVERVSLLRKPVRPRKLLRRMAEYYRPALSPLDELRSH
jgi:signal transduction histidine kinase/ActR/RegA family two-component response regulator